MKTFKSQTEACQWANANATGNFVCRAGKFHARIYIMKVAAGYFVSRRMNHLIYWGM